MRVVIVFVLLLLNGLLWAWGQGDLARFGWPAPQPVVTAAKEPLPAAPSAPGGPATPAEPTATAAVAVDATDPLTNITANSVLPTACWQARFWAAPDQDALQQALTNVGDQVFWRLLPSQLEPRWVVMMRDGSDQKALKERLKRAGITFRPSEPPLPEGLIVGTFSNQAGADSALAELRARGETGFEVQQARPEVPVWEVAIYAASRELRDTVLARLNAVPRYSNAELRVVDCADTKKPA
jgi:hypothetical protein